MQRVCATQLLRIFDGLRGGDRALAELVCIPGGHDGAGGDSHLVRVRLGDALTLELHPAAAVVLAGDFALMVRHAPDDDDRLDFGRRLALVACAAMAAECEANVMAEAQAAPAPSAPALN